VGPRFRLGLAATSAATCAAVVLGLGIGGPGIASAEVKAAARRITVSFFHALDHGRWSQACSMLAQQFYRRNHVPDRRHCISGFRVGMGGWAVKYRIGKIDATTDSATVHAVVDGDPGSVMLVREKGRLRVLALRGG